MSYDKNQFELAPPWLKDQNQPRKVKQNILTGGDSRQITGRLSSRSSSRDNSRTRIFKIKRKFNVYTFCRIHNVQDRFRNLTKQPIQIYSQELVLWLQ